MVNSINGIRFTAREIDVISCLINGRGVKKIASLLALSPRTVETHIRNISLRIERSSKEEIIDFVEKSKEHSAIKSHYLNLLARKHFERKLQEISKLWQGKQILCCFHILPQSGESRPYLISSLKEHLHLAGIKSIENLNTPKKQTSDLLSIDIDIYVLSGESIQELPILEIFQGLKNEQRRMLFLALDEEVITAIPPELRGIESVNFANLGQYHKNVFELLKKGLPQVDFSKVLSDFETNPFELSNIDTIDGFTNKATKSFYKKNHKRLWFISSSFVTVFCLGLFWLISKNNNDERFSAASSSISSDLPIPKDQILLQRPDTLQSIDKCFDKPQEIQTVALVGIGGAGKTTLAHQYVRSQKASVVWEINAETHESLKASFGDLAQTLAITDEEQKIIRGIQDINNSAEKEDKIIQFVKKHLRTVPSWILIYDNVEKFSDLQKYFPNNLNTWGRGKVIVTTRDSNILNNQFVHYVIPVGELSPDQKLNLFVKVMSNKDFKLDKEEIKKFLAKLPPYPLDISVAAYYIRATNVTYASYLEYVDKYNKDFIKVQENLLKEATNYTKTRYGIIALSLHELIRTHEDFSGLLLFISLLDSQNIPRELLNKYKDNAVVNNFMYHLKKYSLINTQSLYNSSLIPNFSMHRSTQSISIAYLMRKLNLYENKQLLRSIVKTLVDYIDEVIDKEELSKLKNLIVHCETFLNHDKLLDDMMRRDIHSALGAMYYILSDYEKSCHFLELSLIDANKHNKTNGQHSKNSSVNPLSLIYLGNAYRRLGNQDKARELLEQGINQYKKMGFQNHFGLARALAYLGNVYRRIGDYETARDLLEDSIERYKKLGFNHIGLARGYVYLGNVYRNLGDYKNASCSLKQAMKIYEKYDKNHPGLGRAMAALGNVYRDSGNLDEAKNLLEHGLDIYKKNFTTDHIHIGWILVHLGNTYRELKDFQKATKLLEEAFLIYEKNLTNNHLDTAWVGGYLGKAYMDLGDYSKAKETLHHSLTIYEANYKKTNIKTNVKMASVLVALGQLYFLEDQSTLAEELVCKAIEILQNNKQHPEVCNIFEDIAKYYLMRSTYAEYYDGDKEAGKFKQEAIKYFNKSLAVAQTNLSEDSLRLLKLQDKIKQLH